MYVLGGRIPKRTRFFYFKGNYLAGGVFWGKIFNFSPKNTPKCGGERKNFIFSLSPTFQSVTFKEQTQTSSRTIVTKTMGKMELQPIQQKIQEIRGQKVMLDFDLASRYETETIYLQTGGQEQP